MKGDWLPISTSLTATLSAGDGVKTIEYVLRDEAGNESTVTDSIILDSTIPTGAISVNGGAQYATSGSITVTNSVTWAGQMRQAAPIVAASAGENFAFAVAGDGVVYGTGYNYQNQLGAVGGNPKVLTPTFGRRGWSAVSAGYQHSLMLGRDGSLWAVGLGDNGQLGTGSALATSTPVRIGSATNWVSIAAGQNHSAAVNAAGELYTWGFNGWGQLGDGTGTARFSPVLIGTGYKQVSANYYYTIAVKNDGSMWAWGMNQYGAFGNGGTAQSSLPTRVSPDSTGWEYVSAGRSHVVALKADGTVWAWGLGTSGQTTGPDNRLVPAQIGTGFKTVAAGDAHSGGVKQDGTLWMWGSGSFGQLGLGDSVSYSNSMRQVGTDGDWSSLSLGSRFSIGVKTDGTTRAWGQNTFSQLGDNTVTQRTTPTLSTLPGWVPHVGSHAATILFPSGTASIWNGFKDEAGNVVYLSDEITFDTLPPVTTHSGTTAAWMTTLPTVTLSSDDDGMGVESTFYTLDGGATQAYSSPFDISKEGTTTLAYRSVDKAGRSETTKTVQVRVDTGKPSSNPDFSTDWNSNTLSFAPTDTVSGVAATYYSLNSGAVTTFTAPFTVPDGLTNVRYWTVDRAGNAEAETTVGVRVDLQAPVTESSALPVGWVSYEVTVTLSPTDVGGGGVARTMYVLDGGAPKLYEDPFVVGAGDHVLEFWSEDRAGNIEPRHTEWVQVDPITPVTTTSVDDAWHATPVSVSFIATDPLSGLVSTEYRIDGGALNEYLTPFTIFGEGVKKLEYRSTDAMGNVEAFNTAWIRVDYTAPVTTLAGVPSGPRAMAVELVPSASDGGSGVEKIYYRLDGGQDRPYAADQTAIVVAKEGTTTVEYWSVDAVRNAEAPKSIVIEVDYSEGGGSTVSGTANAPCIQCHGAPTGTQVAVQNFSVTDVDRSTACRKCHTPGLVGSHPNHYVGGNCGAVCHIGQMGQSLLSATPTQLTEYGAFASVASKDLSSDQLHVIHASYRWAADTQYAGRKCGSCHARAACDACHTGTLSPAHAQHSAAGNVRYPARVAQSARVGSGIVGEDQTYDSIAVVTEQCGVTECHDTSGLKESEPVAREDFTHAIIGTTPANTVTATGKWVNQVGGTYTFGRRSASNTKGSTLTLAFSGTKVAVLGGKSSSFGNAEFLIDGILVGSTSTYSPTNVVRTTLFTSGELVNGPHTITVRVAGTKPVGSSGTIVAVDQFQTWTRLPAPVAPLCGATCHPGKEVAHGYDGVDHVADSASSIEPVSGARCDDCHSMDLLVEHERVGSVTKGGQCQTCHANPRRTFGAWNQTCQQGGCHMPGTTEKRHAALPSVHRVAVDGTCTRNCHQTLLPGEHAKSGGSRTSADCVTCHNSSQYQARARTLAWDGSCVTCHTGSHDPNSAGTQLCLDCHGASSTSMDALAGAGAWDAAAGDHGPGYASSAHGSQVIAGTDGGVPSDVTCEACHNHNAIADGSVTDFRASGTSQQGAALCFECHSASGDETRTPVPNTWNGRDLAVEFARPSAHPVVAASSVSGTREETISVLTQTTALELATNSRFQVAVSPTQGAQLQWDSWVIPAQTRQMLFLVPESTQAGARSFSQFESSINAWNGWSYDPANPSAAAAYAGSNGLAMDNKYVWTVGQGSSSRMRYTPKTEAVPDAWEALSPLPFVAGTHVLSTVDIATGIAYYAGNNSTGTVYPWRGSDDTWSAPFVVKSSGNATITFTNSDFAYSPAQDRLYTVTKNWYQQPVIRWVNAPAGASGQVVCGEQTLVQPGDLWGSGDVLTGLTRFTRGSSDYLIYEGPTLNAYGSQRAYLISGLASGVHTMTPLPEFFWHHGGRGTKLVWDGGDYIYALHENSSPTPGRIRIPSDPVNGAWGAWELMPKPPGTNSGNGSMAFLDVGTAEVAVTGYRPSGSVVAEVDLPEDATGWGRMEWQETRPAGTMVYVSIEGWDGAAWEPLPGMQNRSGGSVDLTGLDSSRYGRLRLIARLTTWSEAATPALRGWSVTARTPVDVNSGVTSLSCASCHNSHTVESGSGPWDVARISSPGNTRLNPADTTTFCLECHSLGGLSRGKTATSVVPSDIGFSMFAGNSFFPGWEKDTGLAAFRRSGHYTTTGTKALCETCHDPHASQNARLTAWTKPAGFVNGNEGTRDNTSSAGFEENLCFQCHGNGVVGNQAPGAQDVASVVSSTYRHDPSAAGMHSDDESAADTGANRHAECTDCHDPHAAQAGAATRIPGGPAIASPALLGATGLKPIWGGAVGSSLTSYTATRLLGRPGDVEAYVCFKCHTSASGRPAAVTSNGTSYTSTDLSAEFNPSNGSFHNVLGLAKGMKDTFIVNGTTYTWPIPADNTYLKPGWTRDSMVTCSDCHTSGAMSSAKGPHGSSVRYLLDPEYPADYRQASLDWRESDGVWPTGQVICTKCHVFSPGQNRAHGAYAILQTSIGQKIHTREYMDTMKCTSCHIAIPHGWKRPRLLINSSDPAAYRSPYARGPLANIRLRSRSGPSDWWQNDCAGCGIFAHPALSPAWP